VSKTIKLDHITKIEGHASLRVTLKNGDVDKCELSSIEGARYFEEILQGRDYTEAFEISSRICGVCSSAHTVCALMAIENALGLKPSTQTFKLRELLTLGERIRSHATHLYFLALPDYMGFESAMAMLPKYKKDIERALRLMKTGNTIIKHIGGRDLHPVSAAVGGFLRFPTKEDIKVCLDQLKKTKKDAIETGTFFMKLKQPKFHREIEIFSLSHKEEYGMLRGDLKSRQKTYKQAKYDEYLHEYHDDYSTAKFVVKEGKEFRVGALARLENNHTQLSADAKKLLKQSRLKFPCHNPFYNNFAQAVELIHCTDEAIKILKNLKIRHEKPKAPKVKAGRACPNGLAGRGVAAIEVPRGILWHEYELDKKGKIKKANIITPTTQNLRAMQEDIRAFLPQVLHLKKEKVELEIEKLIRSYDPCFSCSTHFLKVDWE